MSAFLHNFNFGFLHGMFNGMFGGLGVCNWGYSTYNRESMDYTSSCFTPNYFTSGYNLTSFADYKLPSVTPHLKYNTPVFTGFNINTNMQSFNVPTPQFQTNFFFGGDTFISTTGSSNNDKKDDKTKGAPYQSTLSTSEHNTYNDLILKYSKKYDVNPNLVKAIIKQESCFQPRAKSRCNAMGLMQLMPSTAKSLGVTDPWDPEQNINGGVKLISQLLKKYDGDVKLALAAYNWGAGNLAKKGIEKAPKETRCYITNVTKYYKEYQNA